MKLKLLFSTLILGVSTYAQAGVFFEPYAGYESGSYKGAALFSNPPGIQITENDSAGPLVGTRLGWQFQSFGLGAEAEMGMSKLKDKTTSEKTDFKTMDLGFYLRWDISRFRIYTTFISSTAKDEALKLNSMKDEVKGDGMKLGVGYRFMNNVALNLEFLSISYKKAEETNVLAMDADRKTTRLVVSFPFGSMTK